MRPPSTRAACTRLLAWLLARPPTADSDAAQAWADAVTAVAATIVAVTALSFAAGGAAGRARGLAARARRRWVVVGAPLATSLASARIRACTTFWRRVGLPDHGGRRPCSSSSCSCWSARGRGSRLRLPAVGRPAADGRDVPPVAAAGRARCRQSIAYLAWRWWRAGRGHAAVVVAAAARGRAGLRPARDPDADPRRRRPGLLGQLGSSPSPPGSSSLACLVPRGRRCLAVAAVAHAARTRHSSWRIVLTTLMLGSRLVLTGRWVPRRRCPYYAGKVLWHAVVLVACRRSSVVRRPGADRAWTSAWLARISRGRTSTRAGSWSASRSSWSSPSWAAASPSASPRASAPLTGPDGAEPAGAPRRARRSGAARPAERPRAAPGCCIRRAGSCGSATRTGRPRRCFDRSGTRSADVDRADAARCGRRVRVARRRIPRPCGSPGPRLGYQELIASRLPGRRRATGAVGGPRHAGGVVAGHPMGEHRWGA